MQKECVFELVMIFVASLPFYSFCLYFLAISFLILFLRDAVFAFLFGCLVIWWTCVTNGSVKFYWIFVEIFGACSPFNGC